MNPARTIASAVTFVFLFLLYCPPSARGGEFLLRVPKPGEVIRTRIIGSDNRTPLSIQDLSTEPANTVVRIVANGRIVCTGARWASVDVGTSSHCIPKNWRDAKLSVLTHQNLLIRVDDVDRAPRLWGRTISRDVAVLRIAKAITKRGIIPLATDLKREGLRVRLIGYHADRAALLEQDCTIRRVYTGSAPEDRLVLNCDVGQGSSGGPILTRYAGTWMQVGLMVQVESGETQAAVFGGYSAVDEWLFEDWLRKKGGINIIKPQWSPGIRPWFGARRTAPYLGEKLRQANAPARAAPAR